MPAAGVVVVVVVQRQAPQLGPWLVGFWTVVTGLTWRSRVVAGPEELLVVNWLRRRRLGWGQVARIGETTERGAVICRIRLASGETFSALGLATWTLPFTGAARVRRDIENLELQRIQHARRSTRPNAGKTKGRPRTKNLGYTDWERVRGYAIGFIIAGVLALAFGAYLTFTAWGFREHGQQITATVVQVQEGKYADVTVTYAVDGRSYTEQAEEWLGHPRTGDQVDVVFDRTDPQHVTDAHVAGTSGAFLEAGWVLLVGVAGVIFGTVTLIRH